jgi:hypothetical protein
MEDPNNKTAELKSFNLQEQLGEQLIADVLIRHRDLMRQAHSGILPEWNPDLDNEVIVSGEKYSFPIYAKEVHQGKSLLLLVANQLELLTLVRPILKFSYPDDYENILGISKALRYFRSCLLEANRTKRLEDDFIRVIVDHNGTNHRVELTRNFFDMLEELSDSYEIIYYILIKNKIISPLLEQQPKKVKAGGIF